MDKQMHLNSVYPFAFMLLESLWNTAVSFRDDCIITQIHSASCGFSPDLTEVKVFLNLKNIHQKPGQAHVQACYLHALTSKLKAPRTNSPLQKCYLYLTEETKLNKIKNLNHLIF